MGRPLRRSLLAILVAACESGSGSHDAGTDARPPADLSDVAVGFAPAAATVRQAVGVAYQVPAGDGAAETAEREHALAALGSAGISWVRRDVLWHEVEPSRGDVDFSSYRSVIESGTAAGIATVPILLYGNPWASAASDGDPHHPPDDVADFARFAGAAASALGDQISHYEIWNEPNLGWRFWKPREDPDAYGELVVAAAEAVRDADPDSSIVLGGLLYHPGLSRGAEAFLEPLYRSRPDLPPLIDAVAIHPYPVYPPRNPPELEGGELGEIALPRMLARIRALMNHYGHDAPIWITEVGWPTFRTTFDEEPVEVTEPLQARYLIRSLFLSLAHGAERYAWFTFIDGPDPDGFPPEDAFGLWRAPEGGDPVAKDSWRALLAALELAGERSVVADLRSELGGLPEDAYAYRLGSAGDTTMTVMWRSADDATPATVELPASEPVTWWDLYGEEQPASTSVPVGPAPIYVALPE